MFLCVIQCIDQLTVAQAELQDSVKELTKSRKKYQEAETMAQAVREKAELDAKYDPFNILKLLSRGLDGTRSGFCPCDASEAFKQLRVMILRHEVTSQA